MKWLEKYKQRKQERVIINTYLETLRQIKNPFKKTFGISKIGDVVHKVEVNGIEIESRDPLFIKEE